MGPKQNRKHEHSSMKMSVSRKSQAKLAFVVTTLVLLTFSSSFASQANSLAASRFLSASIAQGEQGTIKVGTVLDLVRRYNSCPADLFLIICISGKFPCGESFPFSIHCSGRARNDQSRHGALSLVRPQLYIRLFQRWTLDESLERLDFDEGRGQTLLWLL